MLVTAACGVLAPSACTSFGAADDGSASEGGTNEGGTNEVGTNDAANAGSCALPTCENFETDSWVTGWAKSGKGGLDVTPGASTSPNRALDMLLNADVPTMLVHTVGDVDKVGRVTARISMLVADAEKGDGDVDLFGIVDAPTFGSSGIFLVHAVAEGTYASEILTALGQERKPVITSFASYVRVTIEVDIPNHHYMFAAGGPAMQGDLAPTWNPTSLYVVVGAHYTRGVTKPWHARFDDAEVITEK